MKAILLILVLLSLKSAAQTDTLKCRALCHDPESSAQNKRAFVTNFYVVLKDGKPVKFLMMDKRRQTTMEIWQYRLVGEARIPKQ